MVPIRSILCPVDFSEGSRLAVRWAAALAHRHDGRLIVLHVVDPRLAAAARIRLGVDLTQTGTDQALRDFVAAFQPPAEQTTYVVRDGDSAEAIVDVAAGERADLIVMGTQGLGGVRKWLLGSTTERVLRRTPVTVFAVPADSEGPVAAGPGSPIAGPILSATDFSPTSIRALGWAASLSADLGNPLLLVHVVEPILVAGQWESVVAEMEHAQMAEARDRLQRMAGELPASPVPELIVKAGAPVEGIIAAVESSRAGLVVMGLAEARGPLSARPGSIAYKVLSRASRPVVVVPPR